MSLFGNNCGGGNDWIWFVIIIILIISCGDCNFLGSGSNNNCCCNPCDNCCDNGCC